MHDKTKLRLQALFLLAACLPLLLVLNSCKPQENQYPQPTDRFFVNDFADIISSADEDAIYTMGVQLQEKTGAQVVAVTVESTGGSDIRQYGLDLARNWGIGEKDKDNGILILLDLGKREITVEVGYGLEGGVTDTKTGIVLDNYAIPHFRQDNFSAGIRAAYSAFVNEVYIEYGIEPEEGYVAADNLETSQNDFSVVDLVPIIFIAAFFILIALRRGGRGGPPFIFMGGGRGGFGGGGGGFGGGGGGFSGGGGSFGGGGGSRRF